MDNLRPKFGKDQTNKKEKILVQPYIPFNDDIEIEIKKDDKYKIYH